MSSSKYRYRFKVQGLLSVLSGDVYTVKDKIEKLNLVKTCGTAQVRGKLQDVKTVEVHISRRSLMNVLH